MSYTATQIKSRFLLKFDLYSAYFTESQLSSILTEAYRRTVENRYREFQGTKKITEELAGLITNVTGAPTTSASHDKPADYKYLLDIRLTYSTGENKKATLYREGDGDDVFEESSKRYPKVKIRDKIYFEPTGVTAIDLVYLKEPTDIDLTGAPNAVIPLPNKTIDVLVDEAVKIASGIVREQDMYMIEDKEVKENK